MLLFGLGFCFCPTWLGCTRLTRGFASVVLFLGFDGVARCNALFTGSAWLSRFVIFFLGDLRLVDVPMYHMHKLVPYPGLFELSSR